MGSLCERNEFSVSVAGTRRAQDDVETSRAKSLCGYEGRPPCQSQKENVDAYETKLAVLLLAMLSDAPAVRCLCHP